MMISQVLSDLYKELPAIVKIVAVSKFHPESSIAEAYEAGQRAFGESRPQEFCRKVMELKDSCPEIEWHFIGHLQTNKLKMVLPYAYMVQSVDSLHLLEEINKWGKANNKIINVLLELHIGAEETKQGFVEEEVLDILFRSNSFQNINFCGLMGMASNSDNEDDIRADFVRISDYMAYLQDLFPELINFRELSIGMSSDYKIALEYGATIVRIGTAIFGERTYE